MILIADSGSTKTDWALINSAEIIKNEQSIGLNPDFHKQNSIAREIQQVAINLGQGDAIDRIYFYGSGASSKARQAPLISALKESFPNSKIEVAHDLLGAARASLKEQAGLVGILGTGSNCCAYNGEEVTKEYRSGGFILSDEGGGVFMGKMLLKAFIEDQLDKDLKEALQLEYGLNVDLILKKIYKSDLPNRFIASFAVFMHRNATQPQIKSIIEANFNAFFEQKVCRFEHYQDLPLGLVGSVANHFEAQLMQAAKRFKCRISVIEARPIQGLVAYHQTKLVSER